MRVDWLQLRDFRSYPELDWKPEGGVNILVGPNGAGKTNLLESIAYLASLRSFRGVPDLGLIADESEAGVIRAGVSQGDRERLIEIELRQRGGRRTQVDKQSLRRSSDMLGVLRVVAFLPEDLDLVKRGPAQRRDLLDDVAVQLWPAAYTEQAEFDRSLRQRNAFLKSGHRDDVTLDVWDARLAQAGAKVAVRRSRVINDMTDLLKSAYQDISGSVSVAAVAYKPTWPVDSFLSVSGSGFVDALVEGLTASRRADYDRRVTTVGPHRDEPILVLDDNDSRYHGSQGEQRTMALAIKLAAHRLIAAVTDGPPILLLDDVFSELDPQRSQNLADSLPGDTQTLITSARPEEVPVGGTVWTVDGDISRG